MEDRTAPAGLDLATGALTYTAGTNVNNHLTVSLSAGTFTFTDTAETITLTSGALAAGFTGSGTNTVTGPSAVTTSITLNLGNGADSLTLGSVDAALPPFTATTTLGSGGTATVLPQSPGHSMVMNGLFMLQNFDQINLQAAVTASGNGVGDVTLRANNSITTNSAAKITSDAKVLLQVSTAGRIDLGADVTGCKQVQIGDPDTTGQASVSLSSSLTIKSGGNGVSFPNADVDLVGNNLNVIGDSISFGRTVTGLGSSLSLMPFTPSRGIVVSDNPNGTPGSLSLPTSELATFTRLASLSVGSAQGTGHLEVFNPITFPYTVTLAEGGSGGTVTLQGKVTTTTGSSLTLSAADGVSQTGSGLVVADELCLGGSGPFSLPLANQVNILAADVTGSLDFSDVPTLLVGVVNGTAGINTSGNPLTLAVNGLLTLGDGTSTAESLTAAGAMVSLSAAGVAESANAVVTSSGLSLQGTGTFNLTKANAVAALAANVTGGLSFTDSLALTLGVVNGTAGINTNGNPLLLAVNGLLTLGDGTSTAEDLTAAGTTVALSVAGVTESANSTVTAIGLGLLGSGSFSFPRANHAGTLAADVTGTLAYTNAGQLIVGAVGGTAGINTGGNSLALTVTGGLLALGDATATRENVTAATVDLNTTGLFENGNSVLVAGSLRLGGSVGFVLNQANQVGTLAADVTEQLAFTDSQALTVGTVLGTAGLNGHGANLALAVGGLLTLGDGSGTAENVVAAGAGLFVTAGGITQAHNSAVTAFGLVLTGTGSFSLAGANGVALLAADVTGALSFTDTQPLLVGAVTSTVGINTHGGNLGLTVTGGLLALGDGGGTAEDLTPAGATVTLDAAGIFENGNSAIVSQALLLQGTVGFVVNTDNRVGTLAGNLSGPLNFNDVQALTVGQVNGIGGLNTNGANVALTTAGLLTLGDGSGTAEDLTAAGAGVFLNSAGLSEAGNAAVTAFTMSLGGTGAFTLAGANALSTLSAAVTGPLAYYNAGSLIALGLSTGTGNGLTLASGGLLALGDGSGTAEPVSAPGATVDILAPGIFQSPNGAVTANSLRLRGGSSGKVGFFLNQANAVGTLAASIVNSLAFGDTQSLAVGSVLGTTGVVTAFGGVTFIADAMRFGAPVQGNQVLCLQTMTAARNTLIAPSSPDPNALNLAQSDINNIVGHNGGQNPAGFTMVVIGPSSGFSGDTTYSGNITVAKPVSFSTSITLLTTGVISGVDLITVPGGDKHSP